jgi:hypothetical protein
MKASFDAPLEDTTEVVEETPSTAVVAATEQLPVLNPEVEAQFDGEFVREDLGTKWLNLVPKSADEASLVGHFLLDREHDLGESVEVIVRKVKKFYLEDQSDDQNKEGEMPKSFYKIAHAEEQGFSLRGKKGENKVVPAAYLDVFVKLTEEHPSADFVAGGFGWASAKIKVKKGGYRATVLILSRDLGGFLKGDLRNGTYTLSSHLAKWDRYSWYEPRLKVAGRTPDEVLQTLKEGFNFFEPVDPEQD